MFWSESGEIANKSGDFGERWGIFAGRLVLLFFYTSKNLTESRVFASIEVRRKHDYTSILFK